MFSEFKVTLERALLSVTFYMNTTGGKDYALNTVLSAKAL